MKILQIYAIIFIEKINGGILKYRTLALKISMRQSKIKKMPIKTAYKLSRLAKRAEEELQFYQKEFTRIVDEYAMKENGQLVYSDDMTSIKIIPGKEDECSKIVLKELEDFSGFEFTLDEFDSLITLAEMSAFFLKD